MEALSNLPSFLAARARAHIDFLATPRGGSWEESRIFLLNWGVQFFFSWWAFLLYMKWDYKAYKEKKLSLTKLPSRHPLAPFWASQLHMVPLVLYNQLVVWPLVNMALIWPQWTMNYRPLSDWSWYTLLPTMIACLLISDAMWYWSHRFMHTPYAWKNWHRMHHIAEQAALSATYVHPVEYAMFAVAMNLPWALVGFPIPIHLTLLGWGMFTGSGAHSGYSGEFANGDKHNGHHLYHNVNFGLLMIADMVWGTHWAPGQPPPPAWLPGLQIWKEYTTVYGSEKASTFLGGKSMEIERQFRLAESPEPHYAAVPGEEGVDGAGEPAAAASPAPAAVAAGSSMQETTLPASPVAAPAGGVKRRAPSQH